MPKYPVFFFGRDEAQKESDLKARRARLGGVFYSPSYALSYQHAATRLLNAGTAGDLDEMALPIFFLQRHAFELVLKAFLETLEDLRQYAELLAETSVAGMRAVLEKQKKEKAPFFVREHRFHVLLEGEEDSKPTAVGINGRLKALGYPPLPAAFKSLADAFETFEAGSHDRSRYTRNTKGQSLPSTLGGPTIVLPLGEIDDKLTELISREFWADSSSDETCLFCDLQRDWDSKLQTVERLLDPDLERTERNDE